MPRRTRNSRSTEPTAFPRGFGNAVNYAIGKLGDLISPKQSDLAQFDDEMVDEPQESSLKRSYESGEEASEPTPTHSPSSEVNYNATSTSSPPCKAPAKDGVANKRTRHLTPFDCRFVTVHDWGQDCAALLLNSEAMEPLQRRATLSRARTQLTATIENLEGELSDLKSLVRTHEPELENEERAADCFAERRDAEEKRREISRLKQDAKHMDQEVDSCYAELFPLLDEALEEAGFLQPRGTESRASIPPEHSAGSQSIRPPSDSHLAWLSSDVFGARRGYVPGAFTTAAERLKSAQSEFHDRQNMYLENEREWRRQRDLGETKVSSEAFDQWYLQEVQRMTREFIEAEAAYDEAKRVAREKGEFKVDEFGFETFSQQSYGYAESVEGRMISHAPTEKIQAWLRRMESDCAMAQPRIPDAPARVEENGNEAKSRYGDDWASHVQSMDFGSGISMLDDGPNRELIEKWQKRCGRKGR